MKKTNSQIVLRMAKEDDAPALLAIYAPYVTDTGITFEYEVPSLEEFVGRIEKTLTRYPYLVAEENGEILGYCFASPFKERAAYGWSVETTIYLRRDRRGAGIGTRLLSGLEALLAEQGILNVNACIAYPNPESIRFHERQGYCTVAHFTRCGYKLGIWYDMVWMEKLLAPHPDCPNAVCPISEIDTDDLLVRQPFSPGKDARAAATHN